MTTVTQTRNGSSPRIQDAPDLNTIPDPRAPSPMTPGKRSPSSDSQHPDLSNEIAALSAKLINAINNQTNLDDALQETRHELDEARGYIAKLERENRQFKNAVESGALVRRADMEQQEVRLEQEMAEERKKRNSAERQKKGMESELETLTGQLFEESNAMVAAARHEKQEAERRADMLKTKLEDSEILLQSQQAQLKQLKDVLQDERQRPRDSLQSATTPTTPVIANGEKPSSAPAFIPAHTRNSQSTQSLPPPESPLHFDHLIHPVVRTDVQSYEDFVGLLRTNKGSTPPSRSASGSHAGLNVFGLGSKDLGTQSTVIPSIRSAMNSSSRSASSQMVPTPGAFPSPKPDESDGIGVSLKDTKYFKRALAEDIEPTLRLDTAPALSWLARRNVLSSVTTGRLIVEPFPQRHAYHSPAYACAMCGEVRTTEEHIRRYRFRASESDEAQRYPVCDYCLARLRSTCDFTSFLRMAKKGVMKNETIDECRAAWEECIKLREKMFWSRVGGGVIPAPGSSPTSPFHGPEPEMDKEDVTQESRSDSDLASVSRADSQRTTSSGQPEATPLTEAGISNRLPSKEFLPNELIDSKPPVDSVRGRQRDSVPPKQSTESARANTSAGATMMSPPVTTQFPPTQSGARDSEHNEPVSASPTRPRSSAASNKAFFEAKTSQARDEQATASPSEPASSNSFKRPTHPASSSKPSSAQNSTLPPQFDVSTTPPSSIDPPIQPQPSRRESDTFPRPSSSKSIKSFSFGPRDGRFPPATPGDAAIEDFSDAVDLDLLTTRTTAGAPPQPPLESNIGTGASVLNRLGAVFTPNPSKSPTRKPVPSTAHTRSRSVPDNQPPHTTNADNNANDSSNDPQSTSTSLATPMLSKSAPKTSPSPTRARPVSTAGALGTPPLAPSTSPRAPPASMVPTPNPISPPTEFPRPTNALSPSPRLTPREPAPSTPPASAFSTPRISFSNTPAPQLTPSAPSTPLQQPAKRVNKVSALASRFGVADEVTSPTITPPPLRPTSRPTPLSRPASSGAGLRSGTGSPERFNLGGSERKPASAPRSRAESTMSATRERRKSIVEDAVAALGSPKRLPRSRGDSEASAHERSGSPVKSLRIRGRSETSRGISPAKAHENREISPVKIPGAFA